MLTIVNDRTGERIEVQLPLGNALPASVAPSNGSTNGHADRQLVEPVEAGA